MVTTRSMSKSQDEDNGAFNSLSQELKDEILNTIKDAIAESMKEVVKALNDRVNKLEETVESLQNQVSLLQRECRLTAMKANDNEQYSRRHNVRIVGFPEEKDENCVEKVTKFCTETLKLSLASTDIDRAHRVGKPSDDKHRAIIVRLQSHRHKIDIMKTRRSLKGTNVFINEDLTKENQKLFSEARKLPNVKPAWTRDGRIFVKHRDNGRIYRIDSSYDFIKYNLSVDALHYMPPEQ